MWSRSLFCMIVILLTASCQKDILTWDLEQLPEIIISAEAISSNEIRISYEVTSQSPVTAFTLYWGEEPNPSRESNLKQIEPGSETGEVIISGLCETTLYYFRAEAETHLGTNLSNEDKTLTLLPSGSPVLAFESSSTLIFPGNTVNFSNLSSDISCEEDWEWYVNDSLFSTEFNSSLHLTQSGIYSITMVLRVTDGQTFEVEKADYIVVSNIELQVQASANEIVQGDLVQFGVISEQNLITFDWEFGDGMGVSSAANPEYRYIESGIYTVSLTACDVYGNCSVHVMEDYITVNSPQFPNGTDRCGTTVTQIILVINPLTGKLWMDRNLGASRVANAITDEAAYGDLYQWGRFSDGHQCRNSSNTINLSYSDTPGHDDFIRTIETDIGDWRNQQNNSLWQGVNGMNNPCPSSFRLPTEAELHTERQSWNSNNSAGAFGSPLKFTAAGRRSNSSGGLSVVGSRGVYWSSTVTGSSAVAMDIASSVSMQDYFRAFGLSVRCIKD